MRGRPHGARARIRRPRSIERIFATNAALTSQTGEAGTLRSRFGHSDSWFIKTRGAANLAVGSLRHRANLTLSPFSVSVRIHGRRTETSTKRYPPGTKHAGTYIRFRVRGRSGADWRCRLAGSPIRRQPARYQHQSRADAAAGGDRRRRRGWPPAAGAGAARQHRTSADDRRTDRYRRGVQYRTRQRRTGSDAATARRRGWRRTTATAAGAAAGFSQPQRQRWITVRRLRSR